MKLLLKKLPLPINTSFSVRKDILPCLEESLHFHSEYELIYVLKGHGMKLVGDSMNAFAEGDLAFLGPNLPHLWKNDISFFQNEDQDVEVIVIQFPEDFLGKDFFHKPDMAHIAKLFQRSKSGLEILGKTNKILASRIHDLLKAEAFPRIIILLDILNALAVSAELKELSSVGYNHNFTHSDTGRMDKVYKYIIDHFKEDINLDEIASVASLSASAFCKYFKKRTKKSFSAFLNEIKIGHSCKLLIEEDYPISHVCYESGFKSLTNFNRQFKTITNLTPYEYRRQYVS